MWQVHNLQVEHYRSTAGAKLAECESRFSVHVPFGIKQKYKNTPGYIAEKYKQVTFYNANKIA